MDESNYSTCNISEYIKLKPRADRLELERKEAELRYKQMRERQAEKLRESMLA